MQKEAEAQHLYQAKVSTEPFLHNSVSDNTSPFLSIHIAAASISASLFPFPIVNSGRPAALPDPGSLSPLGALREKTRIQPPHPHHPGLRLS